jgi:hypothetical protein
MRFYEIALFFIIMNLFGAIFTTIAPDLGFKEQIYWENEETQTKIGEFEKSAKELTGAQEISGEDWWTKTMGYFYNSIFGKARALINFFKNFAMFPSNFISMIIPNLPSQIKTGISALIIFIEGVGIIQFITGRSMREME